MRGRSGRPAARRNITSLVLRLVRENPEWGYRSRRIHGELAGLGVKVAASTLWQILKTNGTGRAARRTGPTWSQFLHSQAGAILACDRALQRADAPYERDRRTLDRGCRREFLNRTLVWNQNQLRRILREYETPPQSAPASPLPARCRAAESAARTGRSGAVPRPKTHSRRWPDQRISPGRVTWTKFSAPTGSHITRQGGKPAIWETGRSGKMFLLACRRHGGHQSAGGAGC
jgi:hypothetical protein